MSANSGFSCEIVLTCLGYADFLFFILPFAKSFAARVVVVTSPEDRETIAVCEHHGVVCVPTLAFFVGGGKFNKGAALNAGITHLERKSWVLIMDADILIPPGVRESLSSQNLRTDTIYGADRSNCDGLDTFRDCQRRGSFVGLPTLARFGLQYGTPPLGYFQLWHGSQRPHGPWYEESHTGADRTDILFCRSFDRREYLPINVVHLDTDRHSYGKNWLGRTSPRFIGEDELWLDLNAT